MKKLKTITGQTLVNVFGFTLSQTNINEAQGDNNTSEDYTTSINVKHFIALIMTYILINTIYIFFFKY